MTNSVTITPPEPGDLAGWRKMYEAYGDFYEEPVDDRIAATTWSWLHEPNHEVKGLVGKTADGTIVGLIHYRKMARPLNADYCVYIDDLFVDERLRKDGLATALINAVVEIARQMGCIAIRWKTMENNYRARSLYDKVAQKTNWITYEINL